MSKLKSVSRRRFLATSALGAVAVSMPGILRAQGAPVKLGVLHPVTGALSYSGQQGRLGATLAIEEINAAGGIKGLGKIDPVLGDAGSTPEGGTAEVEKMNSAGVAAIVGGYASNICLATTQAAARYELPYVVDVGVADDLVDRGDLGLVGGGEARGRIRYGVCHGHETRARCAGDRGGVDLADPAGTEQTDRERRCRHAKSFR